MSILLPAGAGIIGGLLLAALMLRLRAGRRHGGIDAAIRLAATIATVAIGAIAAAISYDHLRILAESHGEQGWRTHAFPLSVDGIELIATLVLLHDKRAGRPGSKVAWFFLGLGFVASLFANIAVAQDDPVARAIAAWPAIALIGAIKMLSGLLEHAAAAPQLEPDLDPAEHVDTGEPQAPTVPTVQLPVDVMRRVPVTQEPYDRWRQLWAELRDNPDIDTGQFADQHGIDRRQVQWIKAVGQTGLLDSPIPPAVRLAQMALANGHQPSTPAPAP